MKMQSVSFKSVDEFLDFLPEEEIKIVNILRLLILDCLPNCKEKLSFNVPFYSLHKSVCFIWPSSVTWGKKATYKGVRIGFAKGYLMNDEFNYLEKGSRKQIFWRDIETFKNSDFEIIRSYLFEAAIIDEQVHQLKSKLINASSINKL